MRCQRKWLAVFPLLTGAVILGCGSSNSEPSGAGSEIGADAGATGASGGAFNASATWAQFDDPAGGFSTVDVYDADREIVRFEQPSMAMVSQAGTQVSGWTAAGSDLTWQDNPIAFRVLFGTEAGMRRAYFTETSTGTICDLKFLAPEQLRIYATAETPPTQ